MRRSGAADGKSSEDTEGEGGGLLSSPSSSSSFFNPSITVDPIYYYFNIFPQFPLLLLFILGSNATKFIAILWISVEFFPIVQLDVDGVEEMFIGNAIGKETTTIEKWSGIKRR